MSAGRELAKGGPALFHVNFFHYTRLPFRQHGDGRGYSSLEESRPMSSGAGSCLRIHSERQQQRLCLSTEALSKSAIISAHTECRKMFDCF
jgi:hypothetical protein